METISQDTAYKLTLLYAARKSLRKKEDMSYNVTLKIIPECYAATRSYDHFPLRRGKNHLGKDDRRNMPNESAMNVQELDEMESTKDYSNA